MKENTDGEDLVFGEETMSSRPLYKREYFAARAMQGILSGNLRNEPGLNGRAESAYLRNKDKNFVAREAVAYADALITALNRPSK